MCLLNTVRFTILTEFQQPSFPWSAGTVCGIFYLPGSNQPCATFALKFEINHILGSYQGCSLVKNTDAVFYF